MELSSITAISPVDGRYANKTESLRTHCSEFALMRERVLIEIRWFIALSQEDAIPEIRSFNEDEQSFLNGVYENFSLDDAKAIKKIEATTNHDVKAVEYFLKEKIAEHEALAEFVEFIHFACTSEDINNLSYARMHALTRKEIITPASEEIISALTKLSKQTAAQAMLSRTHGQTASPTTLGKEIANVVARLRRQLEQYKTVSIAGKINGAVGNFNAHIVAYPEVDWPSFSKNFVRSLDLEWNAYTTQIEPHDYQAELFDALSRFNTILIDFARDVWAYISVGYFQQRLSEGEVGSSTMPHKVNPIDFENAEGNLGMAGALFSYLASRLPISRWQRDLVDSTLQRNIGVAYAHTMIAYASLQKGIAKLEPVPAKLEADLHANWEVLSEAIQTVMRRYGIEKPYEKLKDLTRGKKVDQASLHAFIDNLDLPAKVKTDLQKLTPERYIGNAKEMAETI